MYWSSSLPSVTELNLHLYGSYCAQLSFSFPLPPDIVYSGHIQTLPLLSPATYFAQLYHHSQDLSLATLFQEFFLGHCSRHSVVIHFSYLVIIGLAFPTKATLPLFVSLLLFVSFLFTLNSVHTRVRSAWLSNGFLENFWECLLGSWYPQ